MANNILINFYARVVHKGQMELEDVEPENREAVQKRIIELFGEEGSNNGNEVNNT